jgi:hypothetical protein
MLGSPKNRDRRSGDHFNGTYVPVREPSTASKADSCSAKSGSEAVLVQAGALLINHIAPGRRTLIPSA